MLPGIAQRALMLASDRNANVRALTTMIEGDQVIAATFLATSNSPAYRGIAAIKTVSTAVARLGLRLSVDLLFFTATESVLFDCKEYALEMNVLREHSLSTAVACSLLAKRMKSSPDEASLAGLVHDIGTAIVLRYAARNTRYFGSLPAESFTAIIKKTHTMAGLALAKHWSLPQSITDVIGKHHDGEWKDPMLGLVSAADELAALAGHPGLDAPGQEALTALLGGADKIDAVVKEYQTRMQP